MARAVWQACAAMHVSGVLIEQCACSPDICAERLQTLRVRGVQEGIRTRFLGAPLASSA